MKQTEINYLKTLFHFQTFTNLISVKLLTPFPPILGSKQTPYGFQLTLPLGGTDQSGQDHKWCIHCKTYSCCLAGKSPGEKGDLLNFFFS